MAPGQSFWPDVRCFATFYVKRWSGLRIAGNLLRFCNCLNFIELVMYFICRKLD